MTSPAAAIPVTCVDLVVDADPARLEILTAGRSSAPAILVVHEWWGVNDDIRRIARRFAEEGFTAGVVDLYRGASTSDTGEAMALVNDLQTARAVEVMRAAVRALRDHGAPKVGVTGFCLGGGMAIAAACNVEGVDAAVPFYGRPREEFRRFTAATPPLQGHYAADDPNVLRAGVEEMRDQAISAGGSFELFFYDAPHAFMREADPQVYREDAARLAWSRALDFFRDRLG